MTNTLSKKVMDIMTRTVHGQDNYDDFLKCHKAIMEAVREIVPKQQETDYEDTWKHLATKNLGWNQCREEMLRRIDE